MFSTTVSAPLSRVLLAYYITQDRDGAPPLRSASSHRCGLRPAARLRSVVYYSAIIWRFRVVWYLERRYGNTGTDGVA